MKRTDAKTASDARVSGRTLEEIGAGEDRVFRVGDVVRNYAPCECVFCRASRPEGGRAS